MRRWLLQNGLAFDQQLNALTGGYADETLSSRAYRTDRDGKPWGRFWRPVIDLLFAWQGPEHCRRAYEKERQRIHLPPEMRQP
jgi:hypothetical protein